MPDPVPCPDSETLQQYAVGRVSVSEGSRVRRHLIRCSKCFHEVEKIRESNNSPIAVSSGQHSSAGEEPLSVAEKKPASPSVAKTVEYDGNSTVATFGSRAYSREELKFLGPPQGPDELGRLGNYRILKVLGEGGMGMVFLAQDIALQRLAALKVVKPDKNATEVTRERFKQEAIAAASIQHDHIVTIYQVGEDRDVPFMAMQFLEGEPLDVRLKREKKLPLAEVIRISREVAEGLAVAHDRGHIHRDIKPGNIWLETSHGKVVRMGQNRDRVKILDFGLARLGGESKQHLTKTGFVMGTPGYMAPEQARGQSIDGRCDLFSLGCVMYHMLTGQEPFRGEDVMSTLMALALEDPQPIAQLNPQVPADLIALVMKLLSKNPEDRPSSALDFCRELFKAEKRIGLFSPENSHPARDKEVLRHDPISGPTSNVSRLAGTALLTPESGIHPQNASDVSAAMPVTARGSGISNSSSAESKSALTEAPHSSEVLIVRAQEGNAQGLCPRCGKLRTASAIKGWCLHCGYYPDAEIEQQPTKFSMAWLWILLSGIAVVVIGSVLVHFQIPYKTHPLTRAWWGTLQLALAVFLFLFAEVWAFLYVLPSCTGLSIFSMLFPVNLWVSLAKMLPDSRKPVYLLSWSLTAIVTSLSIIGGQVYWLQYIKIKKQASPTINLAKTNEPSDEEELAKSADEFSKMADSDDTGEEPNALDNNEDTDSDEGKDLPRQFLKRFAVIGYIPEENNKIAAVVIGVERDGALNFGGVVFVGSSPEMKSEAYRHLSPLKILPNPPDKGIGTKAVWIEPKETCEIEYVSMKESRLLESPLFVGW